MLQMLQVIVFSLLLLLFHSNIVLSHHIVETLPGFPGKLPFSLETGYIGVGEDEKVQLFYYFIESERDPQYDPLMLWLTGGPGCSGLSAFLYQNGPLTFNYTNFDGKLPRLELNSYSWTKVANIIFLDQPAGSGYSYAKSMEAYNCNDTLSAKLTYDFLRKWLMDHSKYLKNQLYVAGDSYTGVIVPLIVREIYDGIEIGEKPRMNFKGYMQGNPLTDKYSDYNGRLRYANRMALISDRMYESVKANCDGKYIDANPNNVLCQDDLQSVERCIKNINLPNILEPWCSTFILTSILQKYHANAQSLRASAGSRCRVQNYDYIDRWANDKAVQEALNVREDPTFEWVRCNSTMHFEVGMKRAESYVFNVQSVIDDHRYLIDKSCRALIFSGDHDMVVPHSSTEEWIDSLKLPIAKDWEPWFLDGQIAGYTVSYSKNDYELTYATVKGAGHTASTYKPEECLAMVDRWFSGYPL